MLADCIRLAQTNNEALEALLQKFAPLIKKCGRQLHIEDGNEEMILAFIELVKDFSPSNLRNIDDGTVVQYIKQSMYHYCFRIYKKYHHVETVIGWDEISPKEEAEYLATQDKIQVRFVSNHDPGAVLPAGHQIAPLLFPPQYQVITIIYFLK